MLANVLLVVPVMVVSGSVIISRTVDAVLGQALRDLLDYGLVDAHWLHVSRFWERGSDMLQPAVCQSCHESLYAVSLCG